jgi:hypothetical protein
VGSIKDLHRSFVLDDTWYPAGAPFMRGAVLSIEHSVLIYTNALRFGLYNFKSGDVPRRIAQFAKRQTTRSRFPVALRGNK